MSGPVIVEFKDDCIWCGRKIRAWQKRAWDVMPPLERGFLKTGLHDTRPGVAANNEKEVKTIVNTHAKCYINPGRELHKIVKRIQ